MRFGSFSEMLRHFSGNAPDSAAVIRPGADGPYTVTWREFCADIENRRDVLISSGKTCLGLLCDGSYEAVVEIFAANLAGLAVVMLDDTLPEEMLAELAAATDCDLLFGDPEFTAALMPRLAGGMADGAGRLLFFTSGTTDRAKAVVLTDASLMASAYNGSSLLPLSAEDRLMLMLPLSHVFGFVCGLLWGLSCGASVCLGRGARHYADDLDYFRPTALSAVPLLWGFLLSHKLCNPELKLVLIGAGDCPMQLISAGKAMGIRICFGYGLTETSSGVALSIGDDPYAMTVCPEDKIRIADDGEILIEAPTCIMQGYYKRPADTAAVLWDGVLFTGDIGYLDRKGRLIITGRKKEMLVLPDGTKIFLPEYEKELCAALGTPEAAVARIGDTVTLAVYVKDATPDDIRKKINTVLVRRPRGQQIRDIRILDSPLPRTATGKIKRWELMKRLERS